MTRPEPAGTGATRDIGAVRDAGRKRFPLWLLLLLLLLLLAIVAGILIAVFAGGSDKKVSAPVPVPAVTAASAAPSVVPSGTAPAAPITAAPSPTPVPVQSAATVPSTVAATQPPATVAPLKGGFVGGGTVKPVPAAGSFAAGDTAGTVLFAENSAALTDYARTVIADAAKLIQAGRFPTIVVSGYTDEIAGQPSNLKLSGQRANAVLELLKSDVGPGPTAYSIKDHGESDPIASNDTAAGRQQNRRATITTD